MKVLYAIQGTGNGHLSRAREIIPILQSMCELDLFISGCNSQVELPYEVKFRSEGLSIHYGRKGGVDIAGTASRVRWSGLMREVRELPVEKYDLVINDFEFISAYACLFKGVPCVGFSHQAAFLSSKTPRPASKNHAGEFILKHYAPCSSAVGLHFDHFDDFIRKPVIRSEVRELEVCWGNHYTVYLPHYDDAMLLAEFHQQPDVYWHLFSPKARSISSYKNATVFPIENSRYLQSLASCQGLITGGGFEAPAEAIFLGKKVMAIPIKGQYEQKCNTRAMQAIGVKTVKKIGQRFQEHLYEWLHYVQPLQISYPDETRQILEDILHTKNRMRQLPEASGYKGFYKLMKAAIW